MAAYTADLPSLDSAAGQMAEEGMLGNPFPLPSASWSASSSNCFHVKYRPDQNRYDGMASCPKETLKRVPLRRVSQSLWLIPCLKV